MKRAFIRMMAVAVFATSISAFAASANPKAANNNNGDSTYATRAESNSTPTLDSVIEKLNQLQAEVEQLKAKDQEREREQQTNQEDINKMIKQQDQQWNDSLMGIYGG